MQLIYTAFHGGIKVSIDLFLNYSLEITHGNIMTEGWTEANGQQILWFLYQQPVSLTTDSSPQGPKDEVPQLNRWETQKRNPSGILGGPRSLSHPGAGTMCAAQHKVSATEKGSICIYLTDEGGKQQFYIHLERQRRACNMKFRTMGKDLWYCFPFLDEETIFLRSRDLLEFTLPENHNQTLPYGENQ